MDKLIPIGILLGVAIIGFISKFLELGNIRSRYEFTVEYRNKFINFLNELFQKRSFNFRQTMFSISEEAAKKIINYVRNNN